LSFARANDVKILLRIVYLKQEEQTLNLSWMDLENVNKAPFETKLEERSYNRTVIIDIVRQKKIG
jgi:hypothetical protein